MNGFGCSPLELMATEAMLRGLAYLDEFTYSAQFLADTSTELAANAQANFKISIDADSDFIASDYNLIGFVDGDIAQVPNILILLTRNGSSNQLMDNPQHVLNFTGSFSSSVNSFPGRKVITSLHKGNGSLTVQLTDLSGSNWDAVYFSMIGFKVFYTTNDKGQTGNRTSIFHAS